MFKTSFNFKLVFAFKTRNLSKDKYFRVTENELSMIKSKSNIHHGWSNEEECKAIIADMKERKDYMLDPHTGVGVKVAKDFRKAKVQ